MTTTQLSITVKYLEGRNNPWRVSMEVPRVRADGKTTWTPIVTRVNAKDEEDAKAQGFAMFMTALSRMSKGPGSMRKTSVKEDKE